MPKTRKFIKRNIYKKFKNKPQKDTCAVINLSKKQLTNAQYSVLQKGLSFCPTPGPLNDLELFRDTLIFNRRIRLKHHFEKKNDTIGNTYTPNPFKLPTGWTPPAGRNKDLDTFLNLTSDDISQIPKTGFIRKNLNRNQFTALNELKNDQTITLKPADKGGAIVIMDTIDYMREADRQLSNTTFYKEVKKDLNPKIAKEIKEFILAIKHKLPQTLHEFLLQKHWRTPLFYLLPKIHKTGNPGRPIISQINSPTANMSKVVDHYLKPFIKDIPSYIKDTTHFLQKIKSLGDIPPNSLLVTADVSSLYTTIPHREGILAAKEILNNRQENSPATWILLRFMHFILTKNCFKFGNKYFMQTMGTSMGTIMAPEYAIIFMDKLEREFLNTQVLKPLVWWRYIDDIFFIWPHTRKDLDSFISALNQFHPSIKFTSHISEEKVDFLDTTVVNNQGKLHTTLYTKPTDAHLYLHYNSCHPKHQKESIPFSQALRIRRICTEINDFEFHTNLMKEHFLTRGYPRQVVESAISKAKSLNRNDLLKPKETDQPVKPDIIPLVINYHPKIKNINGTINQRKDILKRTPETQTLSTQKFIVSYRRSLSIKQILVKTEIVRKETRKGSHPCGKNCYLCRLMKTAVSAKSTVNSYQIDIKHEITCNTESVVYLIECKKCKKQYIGQLGNSLKERFRGHLQDINTENNTKPVSKHFTSNGHNKHDVTITGITTTEQNINVRLRTEEALIHRFGSTEPWGMNRRYG